MEYLFERGFVPIITNLKIPVLGICLGMQLFTQFSEENNAVCLSIIPGRVRKFRSLQLKVPHIGWNYVSITKPSPLTDGLLHGNYFYFVHSYYCDVPEAYVLGQTAYGIDFPSIIQCGNFYGVQFHTEKSGEIGLQLLRNFCELC